MVNYKEVIRFTCISNFIVNQKYILLTLFGTVAGYFNSTHQYLSMEKRKLFQQYRAMLYADGR